MRRRGEVDGWKIKGVLGQVSSYCWLSLFCFVYFCLSNQEGRSTPKTPTKGSSRNRIISRPTSSRGTRQSSWSRGGGDPLEEDGYLYFVAAIVLNQGDHQGWGPPPVSSSSRLLPDVDRSKPFTHCNAIPFAVCTPHHQANSGKTSPCRNHLQNTTLSSLGLLHPRRGLYPELLVSNQKHTHNTIIDI